MTKSLQERVAATNAAATPKVEVTIRPSRSKYDRFWVLTVVTCPFCGKSHQHGGGDLSHPPLLSYRLSHCVTQPSRDYELVAEEPKP